MKTLLLAATTLLMSAAPLAAHAFDVESAPTDAHGNAFADDDARFDDLPGRAGSDQALGLGGVSTGMAPGTQTGDVQTGGQLMDEGAMRRYRR